MWSLCLVCAAWICFLDLQTSPREVIRVVRGCGALWLPLGWLAFVLLEDRCTDALTRWTLSAVASYALTTPCYGIFALAGLWLPGGDCWFYAAQGLLVMGLAVRAWRHWRKSGQSPLNQDWRQLDGLLALLIVLSLFVTSSYKEAFEELPDSSRRLATHGDTLYFAAQAYELDRSAPPVEQATRAGLKERAYHAYPHLTTTLIARYAKQPDMLRALLHYQYTAVEVLLCLSAFCIVRRVTGSRGPAYLAVALLYVLAIPLSPAAGSPKTYYFFAWYTHATSNLEPSMLCTPQTYCGLPVIFGVMLAVLQISVALAHGRPLGRLAMLMAVFAAVLLRFRLQSFLVVFPFVMLLLAAAWYRRRGWSIALAGLVGVGAVGGQVLEMRLPVYFVDSSRLVLGNNLVMFNNAALATWPGSEPLREVLRSWLPADVFPMGWQLTCAAGFGLLNIIGVPLFLVSLVYLARRRTWRSEAWAYAALVVWLVIGSIVGATCVATDHDDYSVGANADAAGLVHAVVAADWSVAIAALDPTAVRPQ